MPIRWIALAGALVCGAGFAGDPDLTRSLAQVESAMKGRIGVFALRGSRTLGHRAEEPFAYCSTFKWVLGAAILQRVDAGRLDLARPVPYALGDLVAHSPVTRERVREGHLSVGELCAATIATSDNTAANLLVDLVGGPPGLQAFVRSLGDTTMRFDRREPELNSNLPGDPRDTTSPEAMVRLLKTVLETAALSPAARGRLQAWMQAAVTGSARIQAALPSGWTLAHKTGTGARGAVNDVAVLIPPAGDPIYLCVFTDGTATDEGTHERAIAEVTRQVVRALR